MNVSSADRQQRDRDFATIALPLLPAIVRVAQALTHDEADTDDLVQETFLRAYRAWDQFSLGTDCRRWLATICRHAFIEQRRREGRSWAVEDHELESLAAARLHNAARERGVDDMFTRFDVGPAINKAIAALEPQYREVVLLVDVDEFRYDEAASILGVPVGTVRSRLYRARRQLQEALLVHALDAGMGRDASRSLRRTTSPLPRRG